VEVHCKKHGLISKSPIDECPICLGEDWMITEEERWTSLGICASCGYFDDSNKCYHPTRIKFPFKPRKKSCKYYEQASMCADHDF